MQFPRLILTNRVLFRKVSDIWNNYKPAAAKQVEQQPKTFLAIQLEKIRKVDNTYDELEKYFKEKVVSSEDASKGALSWWKVCLNAIPNLR